MAVNDAFGSLFLDTRFENLPQVAACGAAADHRFVLGELPSSAQLRRMCQQSSCVHLANEVIWYSRYYPDPFGSRSEQKFITQMDEFASLVLDYCYYFRVPGEPCAADFVAKVFSDLHELTDACEAQSGFSFNSTRPPTVTFGSTSNYTTDPLLRPLCGISECDNLVKRLQLKEMTTTCPLANSEQALLTQYVIAYTRVCDAKTLPQWAPYEIRPREVARPSYYPLSGPLPPISPTSAPATTQPSIPPSAPTPVPPLTLPPSMPHLTPANDLMDRQQERIVAPLTAVAPTVLPSKQQSSRPVVTISTSRFDTSGSGSQSGVNETDQTSMVPSTAVSGVPTSTPLAPETQATAPETQATTISTQSIPGSSHAVLLGGVAALVVVVISALLWWCRGRRRNQQTLVALNEAYHAEMSIDDHCAGKPIAACRTIPTSQLSDLRILGGGGNGIVYLVRYTGEDCAQYNGVLAAKRTNHQASSTEINALAAEIHLASSLSHPRIVSFVGVAGLHKNNLQALFEYMEGGDLKQYLDNQPPVDAAQHSWTLEKLQIAIDVADALAYLHTLQPAPVVHRDLKSRNVMLTSDKRAKLGDFGVSRPQSALGTMTTGIGTSRWVAPEVIVGGGEYTTACDVYSFGVVLSELDTHQLPFSELASADGEQLPHFALMVAVATQRKQPSFRDNCPPSMLALARRCLAYDPTQRPRATEVADSLRVARQQLGVS